MKKFFKIDLPTEWEEHTTVDRCGVDPRAMVGHLHASVNLRWTTGEQRAQSKVAFKIFFKHHDYNMAVSMDYFWELHNNHAGLVLIIAFFLLELTASGRIWNQVSRKLMTVMVMMPSLRLSAIRLNCNETSLHCEDTEFARSDEPIFWLYYQVHVRVSFCNPECRFTEFSLYPLGWSFVEPQSWTALSASLNLSLPSGGCVSVVWGEVLFCLWWLSPRLTLIFP